MADRDSLARAWTLNASESFPGQWLLTGPPAQPGESVRVIPLAEVVEALRGQYGDELPFADYTAFILSKYGGGSDG